MEVVGLVPRHVFSDDLDDITNNVLEQLTNRRKSCLMEILLGDKTIQECDDKDISYAFIHMDTPDLCKATYRFASEHIIIRKITVSNNNAFLLSSSLLRWITNRNKAFAASVGNLFDLYGHELFVIGHSFTSLFPITEGYCKYGKERVNPEAHKPTTNLDLRPIRCTVKFDYQFENVHENQYYSHTHVNMESADSFILIQHVLYILQFTMSGFSSDKRGWFGVHY